MPMDRSRYPKDWEAISARIKKAAGDRCQCTGECGLHHEHRCEERNGHAAKWAKGKIVLTVAHLNARDGPCQCAPLCGDEMHLLAMCQRCHLRYDHDLHQRNAKSARRSKKATGDLFA